MTRRPPKFGEQLDLAAHLPENSQKEWQLILPYLNRSTLEIEWHRRGTRKKGYRVMLNGRLGYVTRLESESDH